MTPTRRAALAGLAALGAVAAGLHVVTLRNGFVWDDHVWLQTWSQGVTPRLAFLPDGRSIIDPRHYYPLYLLSLLGDFALWGAHPFGWHLTNLLLHGAVIMTAYEVFRRILPDRPLEVLIAVVLLTVHPVPAEAVAWIMARNELLATLFGLLSVRLWLERGADRSSPKSRTFAWLSGAAALAALLSKENGCIWLLLAPAAGRIRAQYSGSSGDREGAPGAPWHPGSALPLVLAGAAYLVLRHRALGTSGSVLDLVRGCGDARGLRIVAGATGYYLLDLLAPITYQPFVDNPIRDTAHVAVGVFGAILSAVGVVIFARVKRPEGALGIVWVWLALAPSILTAPHPISRNALADRYLYAAIPGLALTAAAAIDLMVARRRWGASARRATIATGLLGCVVAGGMAIRRDHVWATDESLWLGATANTPDCRYALWALAQSYVGQTRLPEAEGVLYQALNSTREDAPRTKGEVAATLAMYEFEIGRREEAARVLALAGDELSEEGRKSIRFVHGLLEFDASMRDLSNKSTIQARAAVEEMQEAASGLAASSLPRFFLGLSLERLGERVDAIDVYREVERGDYDRMSADAASRRKRLEAAVASETDPFRRAYESGRADQLSGRLDSALRSYLEAAQLSPGDAFPLLRAAEVADTGNRPDLAARFCAKAAVLAPSEPGIKFNLAFYLAQAGDTHDAEKAYREFLALEPDSAKAHYQLAEVYRMEGNTASEASEYHLFLEYWTGDPRLRDEVLRRLSEIEGAGP